MKSTMSIASAAAALLLTLPACSTLSTRADQHGVMQQPNAAATQTVETVETVETVNGVAITRTQVDQTVKALLTQSRAPQPLPPEIKEQAEKAALDQLTSAELIYQEAAKIEIKDLDQQIKKKVAEGRSKYPTEAAFDQALKEMGLTLDEMTLNARKNILITTFIEQRFAPKVTVTDAEAESFYKTNLGKYFTKAESVRASHILIKTETKDTPEQKNKAREKAEALLKRVKAGEDFAELAKAESSCPSASKGGDLGSFTHGQMVPPFDKAAFALKPGEISGVVETQFGFHIIKLTEKQEGSVENYADLKEKILTFLKDEKVKKLVSAYIAELRGKAKIEKV